MLGLKLNHVSKRAPWFSRIYATLSQAEFESMTANTGLMFDYGPNSKAFGQALMESLSYVYTCFSFIDVGITFLQLRNMKSQKISCPFVIAVNYFQKGVTCQYIHIFI